MDPVRRICLLANDNNTSGHRANKQTQYPATLMTPLCSRSFTNSSLSFVSHQYLPKHQAHCGARGTPVLQLSIPTGPEGSVDPSLQLSGHGAIEPLC